MGRRWGGKRGREVRGGGGKGEEDEKENMGKGTRLGGYMRAVSKGGRRKGAGKEQVKKNNVGRKGSGKSNRGHGGKKRIKNRRSTSMKKEFVKESTDRTLGINRNDNLSSVIEK